MKIAVKCSTQEQKCEVIKYMRSPSDIYDPVDYTDCIGLDDGCHGSESYYASIKYSIISYEEFERDYLKKPKFEKGKWYRWKPSNSCAEHFVKFDKMIGNQMYHSERIYYEKYEKKYEWWSKEEIVECSKEEYEKYLPDGHPDKIISESGKYYFCNAFSKDYLFFCENKASGIKHLDIADRKYTTSGWNFWTNESVKDLRLATPEEKAWLEVCIEADMFINKEEALKPKEMKLIDGKWYVCQLEKRWLFKSKSHPTDRFRHYRTVCTNGGNIYDYEGDLTSTEPKSLELADMEEVYKYFPDEKPKEEEYRVGDWVMCVEEYRPGDSNYLGEGGRLVSRGPYQIEEIKDSIIRKMSGIPVCLTTSRFRHCYHNEILLAERAEVGDWWVKLTPGNKEHIISYFQEEYDKKFQGDGKYYGVEENFATCKGGFWGRFITTEEFYRKIGISADSCEKCGILYAEDDNFDYFGVIVEGGYGTSPSDKGKRVKVLRRKPDCVKISNPYYPDGIYIETVPGIRYDTLDLENYKYGNCAKSSVKRWEVETGSEDRIRNYVASTDPYYPNYTHVHISDRITGDIRDNPIKIQAETSTIKVPKSASVTLKNTENEVNIKVKQVQTIKIN